MSMGEGGETSDEDLDFEIIAEESTSEDDNEAEYSSDDEADDNAPVEVEVDFEDEDEVLFVEVEDAVEAEVDTAIEDALRGRVTELEDELKQLHQRMLRVAADYENHRRRTEREREDIRKFGIERLLLDVIPVVDNLARAVDAATENPLPGASLLEGVQMVQRLMNQVMSKYGCESFDSIGEPFDPQRHEAVQQVESPDHEPNTVLTEYHRGYFLHERLIRPAMVVVSKRPANVASEEIGNDDPGLVVDDVPIAVDSTGEAHVLEENSAASGDAPQGG